MDSIRTGWGAWTRTLLPLAVLVLAGTLLACGGGGGSATYSGPAPAVTPYVRFAALGGDQEVPVNASAARGSASFSLNPTTRVLSGTVTTAGVEGTAAHIHDAAKGAAGPVVIPLQGGPGGIWTVPDNTVLTEAQYTSLQANSYYVNVHSAAYPGGEIRGQIELRARFASLTGAQEVPASGSAATGYASIAVNSSTGAVYGTVITAGISATAAHIHEAAAGASGPVIVPLTSAGSGVWTVPPGSTLTASQLNSWNSGALYVNVHSTAFPGGEIRGQINLGLPILRSTTLTGAQESTPTPSTATGTASLSINPVTLELSGAVLTSGITATGCHIHEAPAGSAGPISVPLNAAGSNAWAVPTGKFLTPSQFASLLGGNLYINVHSAAYPSGEIRGQFAATSGTGGGDSGGGTGY